jgi:lipopolysaccharide export system permease protein
MVIVGRIQRYIFKECLAAFLLTFSVITLAILLVDVVEELRTIGSRTQISVLTAFQLTMMKAPALILETLPFAMLVGSILAFSQLGRRSEIPAIRAAGVSAWRFLGPVIVLSLGVGVLMVTVFDPVATRLRGQFNEERERLINPRAASAPNGIEEVWLSQGDLSAGAGDQTGANGEAQAIISARRVVGRGEALEDVTFYYFRPSEAGNTEDREFNYRIDAKRAELKSGFWQLTDAVESRPVAADLQAPAVAVDMQHQGTVALPTSLRDDTLISRFASATTIPFWDLPEFIKDGRNAGMDVDPYVLRLHTLLATPVFMTAMSLIGAIVCLRLARSGGLSQLIGAGAMAGFVLFFATKVAAGLSNTGAAPPEAAAWCPPLFALFAVLTLLAHNEDG